MSDESAPTAAPNADLEELERRMASFESATKRLGRSVGGLSDPTPAGHASPPRPATRRLSESMAPRGEEISGLRPAVQSQGPQTGALTARARNPGGATPGFTSAFGKPAIPASPSAAPVPDAPSVPAHSDRRIGPWRSVALVACGVVLLALLALPQLFPVLPDAVVWAEESTLNAATTGQVTSVPVRVGAQVAAGQVLVRIGADEQKAVTDGTVVRVLVMVGQRVASGEPIASFAISAPRIIATLPESLSPGIGDRARVMLLGENRWIDAAVESVLEAGAAGPGSPAMRRVVLLPAPQQTPLQLNRGARVTLLGSPSSGRQLLGALRMILPW